MWSARTRFIPQIKINKDKKVTESFFSKFKEEYLLYIKNTIAKFKIRDLFINVSKLFA